MAAFFLACMSSLLLILLTSYVYQLLEATRRRLPPGPTPLPVIGNLLDVASRLPHRSLSRLSERCGPLMTVRLGTAVVVVDRDAIRAFLTDLFLAALDTVSSAIEWAMAELLQNPDTMTKLKKELASVVGTKTYVEYSDVGNLPYLQAVVKEALRLHAVVPLVPNKAETTVEIAGHTIPKGSTVIVNLWAIHRSAEAWTEPSKFIPERFLAAAAGEEEDKEPHCLQGTESFEFMPFGAGRRICQGLLLATRMLHALLGSLVRHFEWSLPQEAMENCLDMSEKLGLTMSMANPLHAIVKGIRS